MRIINFGSLNIDKVYQVEQFVRPGQTITAKDYAVAAGGKGLNQSLAAARAGAEVLHAGAIGAEGRFMADLLRESGADTSLLREVDGPSGHAVIEINAAGQNRIIVFGGANRSMTSEYIERVLDTASRTTGCCCRMRSTSCRRSSAVRMKRDCGWCSIRLPCRKTSMHCLLRASACLW